jgi:hydroxyacylglutathione hydrolase
MFFRQYQLSCLSLFSYLIGDTATGRAVVVDPQRDITGYLDDARANGLAVERVIETHFHADFLSGHLELAAATGAVISYGSEARAEFPIEPLTHGQRIGLGEVVLEIHHTPGHTPESISVVVWEHASDAVPWAVLTGDALFVGDVGRPDLLTSLGFTAEQLARQLYRSLHELLSLPDETRVFPAHGAGSACGKSMSDAVSSTIGEQRRWNYALQPMSEHAFVEVVTQGQSVAPLYFAYTADSNRRLRDLLDDAEPPVRFGVEDLERCLREDAVVIDGRSPEVFASGHLRGSINVGMDGRFAEYAGDVVRPGQPLVVVADEGRESEAKVRLARIGFDRVRGAVVDVERLLADRPDLAAQGVRLAARDLASWRDEEPNLQILDVRNPSEQESGVVPGAIRVPLPRLLDRLGDLDATAPTVVYCAAGYRSSTAASALRTVGFTQVADLQGGYDAWAAAGLPTVTPETVPSGRHRWSCGA